MARQHMGTRLVIVIAALGLGLPLLMGQGCLRPRTPLTVDAGNDLTTLLTESRVKTENPAVPF